MRARDAEVAGGREKRGDGRLGACLSRDPRLQFPVPVREGIDVARMPLLLVYTVVDPPKNRQHLLQACL